MSEQQSQTATAVEAATTSACPHPEAVGMRWGDPISAERQTELQGYLNRWTAEADRGERKGPFDIGPGKFGVHLTGADVFWLAEQSGRGQYKMLPNLHLEGAYLSEAHLEETRLDGTHLAGATLEGARLEHADFSAAQVEGARLVQAHMEGATLIMAHLEGTNLGIAYLERADLTSAHLEGANLRQTWLDSKTVLNGATLDKETRLGDIQWSGVGAVNLTRIDWNQTPTVGDEQRLRKRASAEDYEAVVRAYRQLAAQLRAQGMSEVADRFAYRAQVCQRRVMLEVVSKRAARLRLGLPPGVSRRPPRDPRGCPLPQHGQADAAKYKPAGHEAEAALPSGKGTIGQPESGEHASEDDDGPP